MKFVIIFSFFFGKLFASSGPVFHQLRDDLYEKYRNQIHQKFFLPEFYTTRFEQEIFIDALWDEIEENDSLSLLTLKNYRLDHFSLEERFRLELIKFKSSGEFLSSSVIKEIEEELDSIPSIKLIYLVASYEKELTIQNLNHLITKAKKFKEFHHISVVTPIKNSELIKDILDFSPSEEGLKVYLFCRTNRLYPCLVMLKNRHNQFHTNSKGEYWTHRGLALSSRGLPSHQRNGNTPAGVWRINSVMPEANQIVLFGKFRRLIMEFIRPSNMEVEIKKYLPLSSHEETWWMPVVVARDVGRNDFRIHGTGKLNQDPNSTYYPFVKTAGCIAQRENLYDGIRYIDQRILLDEMMKALDLEPNFENETKIKGLLYVIDIDDQKKAVTLDELNQKGIL